jgi:hypothetical protein
MADRSGRVYGGQHLADKPATTTPLQAVLVQERARLFMRRVMAQLREASRAA